MTQAEKDLYQSKYILELETFGDVLNHIVSGNMQYLRHMSENQKMSIERHRGYFEVTWTSDENVTRTIGSCTEDGHVIVTTIETECYLNDDETNVIDAHTSLYTQEYQLPYMYDMKQGKELL